MAAIVGDYWDSGKIARRANERFGNFLKIWNKIFISFEFHIGWTDMGLCVPKTRFELKEQEIENFNEDQTYNRSYTVKEQERTERFCYTSIMVIKSA